MFVLYETPAGYAIFKLLDEKKLQEIDNLYLEFESPENANKVVKLKHFEKFADTTEALSAATAAVEGKLSKSLKKTLKKLVSDDVQNQLAGAYALHPLAVRKFTVRITKKRDGSHGIGLGSFPVSIQTQILTR